MYTFGIGVKRKTKEVCESCGCTPHAPRRRCPECDDLVCVSNCWNKKLSLCSGCSAKAAAVISKALPTQQQFIGGGTAPSRVGTRGSTVKGKTSRTGTDAFRCYATCTRCGRRQWQSLVMSSISVMLAIGPHLGKIYRSSADRCGMG